MMEKKEETEKYSSVVIMKIFPSYDPGHQTIDPGIQRPQDACTYNYVIYIYI